MAKGRKTGGKPKGYKHQGTIDKILYREELRRLVIAHLEPMAKAQIASATGISHFFLRDPKSGQFVKIEDPKLIEQALNSGDEGSYYYIFTKDPSIQAFTDLMNRALDKPMDQVAVTGPEGGPVVFKWQS